MINFRFLIEFVEPNTVQVLLRSNRTNLQMFLWMGSADNSADAIAAGKVAAAAFINLPANGVDSTNFHWIDDYYGANSYSSDFTLKIDGTATQNIANV